MQVSERGLALTKKSEGCRLRAYQDTGGVWTIGYGHTGGVVKGQTITQEVADSLLRHDILYAARVVNEHCLPCTQEQFDALTDFVFNVGPTQFLSSHLYSYHVSRQYDKAAAEFPKWKYDNGKVIPGLVTRRINEQALYTLRESSTDHQHTSEPARSAEPAVGSASVSPVPTAVQSSVVLPVPTSNTAPASNKRPLGFWSQASESFRKLIAGLGETRTKP